uniref:Uncharacterized protein n=1 Tax=Solanum lycopersicum TaxID=4081 RepID=K4BGH5_SOLLC
MVKSACLTFPFDVSSLPVTSQAADGAKIASASRIICVDLNAS